MPDIRRTRAPASFSFDPSTVELEPSPLDPSQVVSGDPQVAERVLWSSADGRRHRGVWQHGVGVSTDVEVDGAWLRLLDRAGLGFQS